MNFCLFTHTWAWVEGGYNIHTRHFGGFRTYLHTFTFLSYLFFQNTNVGIIVYVCSSSLHEKRNEPIQIQATHALPYRQFLIHGEKDTIFRGFLSKYTLKCLFPCFSLDIAGPKKGSDQ